MRVKIFVQGLPRGVVGDKKKTQKQPKSLAVGVSGETHVSL